MSGAWSAASRRGDGGTRRSKGDAPHRPESAPYNAHVTRRGLMARASCQGQRNARDLTGSRPPTNRELGRNVSMPQ